MQAAGLIRPLQIKDRLTKLTRALEELRRLIKTLYMLRFIGDEAYQRAFWLVESGTYDQLVAAGGGFALMAAAG